MGVRFEAMRGDTEQLRAAMAHIRDHLPADAAPGPTMDPRMLAAIGIEAADILDFALPVEGGHAAVQLLITPSLGLRINRLVASAERDVLGEAERSELVGRLIQECLVPAFEATPGAELVLVDGDEVKHIRHRDP